LSREIFTGSIQILSVPDKILTIYPLNPHKFPKFFGYYDKQVFHWPLTSFHPGVNSFERSVLMLTANTIKVNAGNMDRNTQPSTETLELVRAQLGQPLEQESITDHNLTGLMHAVAHQVATEHKRYLQRFFVTPE
jgi:hypothetical protein